jgi:hypothetical protein
MLPLLTFFFKKNFKAISGNYGVAANDMSLAATKSRR